MFPQVQIYLKIISWCSNRQTVEETQGICFLTVLLITEEHFTHFCSHLTVRLRFVFGNTNQMAGCVWTRPKSLKIRQIRRWRKVSLFHAAFTEDRNKPFADEKADFHSFISEIRQLLPPLSCSHLCVEQSGITGKRKKKIRPSANFCLNWSKFTEDLLFLSSCLCKFPRAHFSRLYFHLVFLNQSIFTGFLILSALCQQVFKLKRDWFYFISFLRFSTCLWLWWHRPPSSPFTFSWTCSTSSGSTLR